MSRPVDDKIVKLSLNNSDFLNKVKSSISAFSTLTNAFKKVSGGLDFGKAESSLRGVSKAATDVNISKIGDDAGVVQTKFSALSVVAMTALSNITSRAMSAGSALVKSFAIEPILSGFNMYESKLKAIQVILANTEGKSNLNDVTKSLGVLNDYANKTIYSFEDMTTNMGTFTAAGVDLKTSQIAIQGIGNLAASSGSSTQQAAMAMYQLSQAIASGKVGLQDWNSVVNAGMGGKKFQTALQNTAKAMGKNVDQSKSFRDSLSDGWLTTDVLMKTLQEFANDKSMLKAATQVKTYSDLMDTVEDELKSGWSQTFEYLIGGFTEAPKLWTGISNVVTGAIQKQANARNELAKGFVELGGRSAVITGLSNTFEGLGKVITTVQKAFRDVFPPATAQGLANAAKSFASFSKHLIMSDSTASKVRATFRGLFSVIDLGIKVVTTIGKAFIGLIPSGLGSGLLSVTSAIGDMITGFDRAVSSSDGLSKSASGIGKSFSALGQIIQTGVGIAIDALKNLGTLIGKVADATAPGLQKMADQFGKTVGHMDITKLFGAAGIGAIVGAATKFTKSSDEIKDALKGLLDSFKLPEKFADNFTSIKDSLVGLQRAVKAATLVEIAAAMVAMAVAMKLIQGLSFTDISKGLEVVGVSMLMLTRALKAISSFEFVGTSAFKAAIMLTSLANALMVLAIALKLMSTIDPASMATALIGLAASLTLLVVGLKAISKIKGVDPSAGSSLIAMASALVIMSGAVAIMGALPLENMVQGLAGLAVVLSEVAVFCLTVSKVGIKPSMAVGLNLVATSMVIMSGAVAALGAIDLDNMIQGLSGLAAVLTEIAAFTAVTSGLNLMAASVGLNLVATAMNLMVIPIAALGAMDPMSLAQGLLGLAVALAEITVAAMAAQGSLAGAAAIVVMATAVTLLAAPLKVLSSIPMAAMAVALVSLGAALGIMVAAGMLAQGVVPGLLAMSVALGALGLVVGAIGIALAGFSLAMTTLAGMTATSIAAVVAALGIFIASLTTIIPQIVTFGVTLVTSLAAGIAQATPALANSGLQMIVGILNAINSNIYQIVALGLQIVTNLANSLADNIGPLIEAGTNLIIQLVTGMANSLRENSAQMVDAAMNLIEAVLEVFVDGLSRIVETVFGWIPGVKGAVKGVGKSAKEQLRDAFDVETVGKKKGKDFADSVTGTKGQANTAGKTIGESGKNGAMTADLLGSGKKKGLDYVNGVTSNKNGALGAGKGIGNGALSGSNSIKLNGSGKSAGGQFVSGVTSKNGAAGTAGRGLGNKAKSSSKVSMHAEGSYAGQGFVEGIRGWAGNAAVTAARMARGAKNAIKRALGIRSPSRVLKQIGVYFGQGFDLGIQSMIPTTEGTSKTMADKAVDAFSNVSNAVNAALDDNLDLTPTITPVLDARNLTNQKLMASVDTSLTPSQLEALNTKDKEPTVSIGDINMQIDAKDAVTAKEAGQIVKDTFKDEMTNEIRKLRIVR